MNGRLDFELRTTRRYWSMIKLLSMQPKMKSARLAQVPVLDSGLDSLRVARS